MPELVYITLEQAVVTHDKTVAVSGGGALGQLNIGLLDSVLVKRINPATNTGGHLAMIRSPSPFDRLHFRTPAL